MTKYEDITTTEIEATCSKLLKEVGVTFRVMYIRYNPNAEWGHDEWEVTLCKQGEGHKFPFHTGTGLRRRGKPVKPSVACVLHSLLLDGAAMNQSFDDWCDEYGYNSDSIKDFNTYRKCVHTGRALRKIFSQVVWDELSLILQNY